MAFDRMRAQAAVVEILDALNGDRVIGLGVRLLDDVVATSCRSLPRPTGTVYLPSPDAPSLPVLVRLRKPGTASAAFAVVSAADPASRLVLLRSGKAAGLEIPGALNPVISAEALIEELEPAPPDLTPVSRGPALVYTGEAGWYEGTATPSSFSFEGGAPRLDGVAGAPVFNPDGRTVGIVDLGDGRGGEAPMCLLADHLPGWVLRRARAAEARYEAIASAR
jgi:hypothetical protein